MPRVLVVCPQQRDRDAVLAAGLVRRYEVIYAGPDLDALVDVDVPGVLAELEAQPADGVVATKDRSALLAAVLAERRGLAGPQPAAVVRCQHKLTSRRIQRAAAPESTPRFALLDGTPPFEPPFFAKPVVGRLSQGARRIDCLEQLAELPSDLAYERAWAEIAALAGLGAESAGGYIAEELVTGDEVTLEGYVHDQHVTVIGITDSVKYPGTGSFERFEHPTALGPERRAELDEVARTVIRALGFDSGFFNVEFAVPEAGPARILEVNGRIASQFAPLVQAVHGRSTYDALFELACGSDPAWEPSGPTGVAVSYVIRLFEDALVERVPPPEQGLEVLVRPGERLSRQGVNDEQSFRLAIFYESAPTRDEALERCRKRAKRVLREFDLRSVRRHAG